MLVSPVPLRQSAVTRLSDVARNRDERSRTLRETFERKVELMEKWAIEGVPEGQGFPTTAQELQRWYEPEKGLLAWSSPNGTTRTGPHGDLRERFEMALALMTASIGIDRDADDIAIERERRRELDEARAAAAAMRKERDEALSRGAEATRRADALEREVEGMRAELDEARRTLSRIHSALGRGSFPPP